MGIKDGAKQLQKEVRVQFGVALAGAFAFVIALSWNEFIKDSVNQMISYFGLASQTWLFKLITAILITIICVIGIHYFSRWRD